MIYDLFAVYDQKADAHLPPFILPTVAMGKRIFADCVNSPEHQFGKNPEDYTLFRLGQFDDQDGQFLLERAKQSLGNGLEFLRQDDRVATEGPKNGADPSIKPQHNAAPVLSSSPGENPSE